jgi:ERCC4-type nuclease
LYIKQTNPATMIITVDSRETALLAELQPNPLKSLSEYVKSSENRKCYITLDEDAPETLQQSQQSQQSDEQPLTCSNSNHVLRRARLALGDATLSVETVNKRGGIEPTETILFERKTIADFAASIRDGRYREQSFRLSKQCELANHNIVYIIEGDLSKYVDRTKGGNIVTRKALYSAMFTMMFFKGFSIIRTMNIRETAELILNFADKHDATAVELRGFYYKAAASPASSPATSPIHDEPPPPPTQPTQQMDDYASIFKHKERSSQITPENIGEIMIGSVPSISSKTAAAVMCEYKTIENLMQHMRSDRQCLDKLYTVAQNGNKRKLSKLCVDNLFKYLIV